MDDIIREEQRLAVRKKENGYAVLDRFGRFFEGWKDWHTAIFDMGEGRTMVKDDLIFALGSLSDRDLGIYIWEGEYRSHHKSIGGNAYSFVGEWRKPTDEEHDKLSSYETIWGDIEAIDKNSGLEPVACISEDTFLQLEVGTGFCSHVRESMFVDRGIQFKRRKYIEEDPSYKQIIPYVVVNKDGQLFSVKRLEGQTEKRLVSEKSLGIGGHIPEFVYQRVGESFVEAGMRKELQEELHIESGLEADLVGTVYDDSDEVGQVHMGVVFKVDVPETQSVSVRENDKMRGAFESIEDIQSNYDEYENWSQHVIDALEEGELNL